MTSSVSVTVPIWFNLINIELAEIFKKPIFNRSKFVTNRSSPTICNLFFVLFRSFVQADQSFSPNGSSTDLILNFFINFKYSEIVLSTLMYFFEWIE